MPYKFTFDLSRISRFFFTEIAKVAYQKGVHKKVGRTAHEIIKKFKIQEATGLNLSDAVLLLQDLIDMQARNLLEREMFTQTRKRALFLPHCSRKYMDNRCAAVFDPNIPSYICAHCSPDCLINKAVSFAEKKSYDIYILPGGSCVPKILNAKQYEGAVGVACGEEIMLSGKTLKSMGVAGQAVPLIKNGCANTVFNIETLFKIL
ncbi:MAG: DUF116 domain-containing protein [Candidatus Bathyarchaeota archaeon]|nr:DUF116 domain-containing protein [Candidatus Bathyarchaeota archaeon]